MSLLDLIPGGAQARGALMAGAAILTFGTGVAAAEAWERVLPWGLGARLERLEKSLPARDAERYGAGAIEQKRVDEQVVQTQWAPALAQCRADLLTASRSAAGSLAAERDAAQRSSSAAYRLGRASCGGSNEQKPGPGSTPAPGSVHAGEDLRSLVAAGLGTAP